MFHCAKSSRLFSNTPFKLAMHTITVYEKDGQELRIRKGENEVFDKIIQNLGTALSHSSLKYSVTATNLLNHVIL